MTDAVTVSTIIGLGAFAAIIVVGMLAGLVVVKVDEIVAKDDH